MFQFPAFALLTEWQVFNLPGCPIRISADQLVCANPRSFSQLTTSFFASQSLGIRHTPLTISSNRALVLGYSYLPCYIFLYFTKYLNNQQNINIQLFFCLFYSLLPKIYSILVCFTSVCQWTSFYLSRDNRGEYRSRTDDLLRARQAL